MAFQILLTADAAHDLEDICDYINRHDSPERMDYVIKQLEKAFGSLSENPHRGAYPKELLSIGIREYREIFFERYRILDRVMDENVYVLLIADGRRDMQTLLQRRLLHEKSQDQPVRECVKPQQCGARLGYAAARPGFTWQPS
jgi:toxin ParE1/3/4